MLGSGTPKILINENIIDFDLACYIVAHECGHAILRVGCTRGREAKEALADDYANSLGYADPQRARIRSCGKTTDHQPSKDGSDGT